MHEIATRALYYAQIQLLYASAVWIAARLLTSLPGTSATARYWIWVATSANFLLPVGALVDTLSAYRLTWAAPLPFVGGAANAVSTSRFAAALALVWAAGAILMAARLARRIRLERRVFPRSAVPAVDGVLRPRISLPEGIDRLLTPTELDAVLIHEATHARRRDNLILLVHEIGLCLLWFHPMVWMTGARIALYRELSCDESVIRSARAGDLVSALAKLAVRGDGLLLQSSSASHVGDRLARLAEPGRARLGHAATAVVAAVFGALLAGSVLETVAHTACCFLPHR
jgi:beta-lactamase regulating signal transducer with metallopeptidase domain